jgi:hypothetical protein
MKTNQTTKVFGIAIIMAFTMINYVCAQNGTGQGPPWATHGNNINPADHFFGSVNNADVVFKTNSVEKARLKAGGRLGIGTANPISKLTVIGEGTSDLTSAFEANDFANNPLMRILDNGYVGIGLVNPTARLMIMTGGNSAATSAMAVLNSNSDHLFYILDNGKTGVGTSAPTSTLDVHGNLSFENTMGDKISLFDDRTGQTDMYGFGMETGALYSKSNGAYKWYLKTNPGSGDASMLLNSNGLGIGTLNPTTSLDVHGALSFENTLGDKISLFNDRIGQSDMYGFGVESGGIYYKSNGNHHWYVQTNPGSGAPEMTLNDVGLGIGTTNPSSALDVHGDLSFAATTGDKISLFDDRNGLATNYGFGVADGELYYKSNGVHKWYSQTNASGTPHMTLTNGGFLGLGTENPNVNLTIEGPNARMVLRDNAGNNSENAARIELLEYAGGNFDGGAFFWWNGELNRLYIGTKNAGVNENIMVFDRSSQNVGIGTQNLDINFRLAVNGRIRSKEIVVESGWSDFVFEEDYKLAKLSEVESFIKTHKHLPGIPSAAGEMQSKLLMKIEELTLYMIEIKKENEQLKQRIDELTHK